MPRLAALAAFLACALAGEAAGADEHRYVEPGSALEWAVRPAPLPPRQFGIVAASALEAARGAVTPAAVPDADEPGVADAPAAPASALPSVSYAAAAPAPFGPPAAKKGSSSAPDAATVIGDPDKERVAALYVRRTFRVGGERERVKVLRLRARYQDGLVAWINDVEIARRNLGAAAAPDAMAARAHGPEWETFYVAARDGLLRDGDNVLTLEVRPSATRLMPTVDVELSGGEQPHLTRGPIVQRVAGERAAIVFETDLPTVGQVLFGAAASQYQRSASDAAGEPTRHHVLALTGLVADTEVHYQVVVGQTPGATELERSADFSFHTAPPPDHPVRFVVYGDVRSGHEVHGQILRAVAAEAPDFVVATGDMVLRGSDEADWQRFFAVAGALLARVPLYPVIGNHDQGAAGDHKRRFEDVFALPDRPGDAPAGAAWYAFDVAGVHFVSLDSNRYDDERQLAWLEADLVRAEAGGARAIFAAAHQGAWSRGPHGGDSTAAQKYAPLLEKHGASVFFSGHDHLYERGRVGKLTWIVSGGGGAPLYQSRCGGKAQRACKGQDGSRALLVAHHYVLVEVFRDYVNVCPKRPDGTPLEECTKIDLPQAPVTSSRAAGL